MWSMSRRGAKFRVGVYPPPSSSVPNVQHLFKLLTYNTSASVFGNTYPAQY